MIQFKIKLLDLARPYLVGKVMNMLETMIRDSKMFSKLC